MDEQERMAVLAEMRVKRQELIQRNQELADEMRRVGQPIDPASVAIARLNMLLEVIFPDELARLQFEVRWEQRMNEQLTNLGSHVRRAILTQGVRPDGNGHLR